MTDQPQSQIFGVSIRGWIAFTLVASICGLNAFSITIDETLKHAVTMTLGFYFGQKGSK